MRDHKTKADVYYFLVSVNDFYGPARATLMSDSVEYIIYRIIMHCSKMKYKKCMTKSLVCIRFLAAQDKVLGQKVLEYQLFRVYQLRYANFTEDCKNLPLLVVNAINNVFQLQLHVCMYVCMLESWMF